MCPMKPSQPNPEGGWRTWPLYVHAFVLDGSFFFSFLFLLNRKMEIRDSIVRKT
ncbi:hypothetical protein BDV24DRAFT_137777 [Aspergillus arachidicola]|uniref:Uncharacterized protein n=1 Tax=Aspergillus arachidicola TaxID=656916 RepID=A0A5N6Y286_9EURO|nr:hypothetical protein BDV24DRAFT_137777 [Aspergillus arachidicola]